MKDLRIRPLILSVIFLTWIYGGSSKANAQAQETVPAVAIPRGLDHAAEFVDFLRKANVRVEKVGQSHFSGLLGTKEMAAVITTDKGVLEVVFFQGKRDAEKITITYEKSSASSEQHLYSINGEAVTGKRESINAAYPMCITLHQNWFIITIDCEMEAIIKRALRQTNILK